MGVKVISKAIIQLSPYHYFWHFSLLFPFWKRTMNWGPIKDISQASLWTLDPLHTHRYDYCFQNVQGCFLMVSDITQRRTSPSVLPLKSLIKLLQWSMGDIAYTGIKWLMALQRSCHKVFHKYSIKRTVFLQFTLLHTFTVWRNAPCFIFSVYYLCCEMVKFS